MQIDYIRLMFAYNYWANHLILDRAAQLTPEQYKAPRSFSFGGLHGTLVHLLDAEIVWRGLLQHSVLPKAELHPDDFADLASVRALWADEEAAMNDYLAGLTDADLLGIVTYQADGGVKRERVLWHCLYHVVNHGMQHRAELAAMLTDCDQSPGELDFTVFLNGR